MNIRKVITITKTILGTLLILGVLFIVAYSEHHYVRTGFCKKVLPNIYYFYDSKGNKWEFYSDEEINAEDMVEVKMFSNCTIDDIKDDMIIDYKIISDSKNEN